ncbi:MAG: CDP-alcohol phosphatidyltransferase family protein [Elusimicrobiota bacterium]
MSKASKLSPGAVKSAYTEEPVHSMLRPIASATVKKLANTSVTANQITSISAIFGIIAGISIAAGAALLGGFFLFVSMILDCADGQLARIRGGGNRLGRILDGSADYITSFAVHTGLAIYLSNYIYGAWLWVLAAALSMAFQCIYFDYRKQWFLSYLSPDKSELDSLEFVNKALNRSQSPHTRIALKIYVQYLYLQKIFRKKIGNNNYISNPDKQKEFVYKSSSFIKTARLLGPAGHNFLISVSLVLSLILTEAPFIYVLTVLFPLNFLFIIIVAWGYKVDSGVKKILD